MLLKLSWYFWKFFPPMQHWLPPHMKSHHHVKRLKDMSIALSKLHFYLKCFLTVLSLNMYNSFLVSGRLPSPLAFVLTLCLQLSHTWLYTFFFSHLSSVLQSECFCPLPRFMYRNQRPKVMVRRLLGDHYLMGVESSWIGLEPLQKMPQAVPLTLPPCKDTVRNQRCPNWRGLLNRTWPYTLAFWSWASSL